MKISLRIFKIFAHFVVYTFVFEGDGNSHCYVNKCCCRNPAVIPGPFHAYGY